MQKDGIHTSFIGIYFQVQLEPTTKWALLHKDVYGTSKYNGMFQATKDIFREEGLPVLLDF